MKTFFLITLKMHIFAFYTFFWEHDKISLTFFWMILVERPKKTKKTKLLRTRFYMFQIACFRFFGESYVVLRDVSSTTKIVPHTLFYHRKSRRLSLRRTRITSTLNMMRGTCLNPIVHQVGRVVANFESQNVNIYKSSSSIFVLMFYCG